MRNSKLLNNVYYLKFFDMVLVGNLHWGYSWQMRSLDDVMNVIRWIFLELLSDEQVLSWNPILQTSYEVEVWME